MASSLCHSLVLLVFNGSGENFGGYLFSYAHKFDLGVYLSERVFMPVKLNLSISEDAARRIKHYAAQNNTSVSKIAEEQFIKLTAKPKRKGKSFVEKYAGTLRNHIPDITKAKDEYLKEKYGV